MSETLEKAKLVRLVKTPGKGAKARATVAPAENGTFDVQFNPTSLKISRQNNVDKGGSTTRTQARQNPSAQSATLSFDLEYDTAEGDASGQPADVRDQTAKVRQFVEPDKDHAADAPPPVRFVWGTFHFSGIVTQLTEDLDYFSPAGRPLRAKLAITITEQDPAWEANATGPGAQDAKAAIRPGEAGVRTGLGAAPAPRPDSTATAQGGESVQQLLARVGADPATWRAAMAGLNGPLALTAGTQVQLSAGLSAEAGMGMSAGFAAGSQLGTAALLGTVLGITSGAGLETGTDASGGVRINAGAAINAGAGVTAEMAAGFALAAGGGVCASVNTMLSARAELQIGTARAAFDVPATRTTALAGSSAGASRMAHNSVNAAAPLDPRTQSFGMAIPLRPRPGILASGGAPNTPT
ncbi:CIS tube protein [Pseudarthrobacter sulfonivorans]|uniref:CIS tube protein n=1 Tax=Pseudarthrobacter sulfonivorans TaxID=121292 RepID=UPI002102632E|nr:hypothetical protein [Pseudarthrobacter sulfonivorans]